MSARRELQSKKRILIKAGTGVLTDENGCVSLGRFGHLVEQVAELKKGGKEVMLVSSGAIAMGKQKLHETAAPQSHNPRACAAAGQSGLMSLYETLFRQKDIWHDSHLLHLFVQDLSGLMSFLLQVFSDSSNRRGLSERRKKVCFYEFGLRISLRVAAR